MTRDTETLIRRLAADTAAVRPLPRPWVRTAAWLALSMGYLIVLLLMMTMYHDLRATVSDTRFLIEQLSALATGITAAAAAFTTVIPGHNRKLLMLPVLPLVGWLESLGPGCVEQLAQFGLRSLPLQHSLLCFPLIVLFSAVPAIAMAVMLRRGAPLTPCLTAALGGLAAAGLGNFGVRLIHPEDVSVMLLVWHLGGVFALSALAGSMGRHLLNWHSLTGA